MLEIVISIWCAIILSLVIWFVVQLVQLSEADRRAEREKLETDESRKLREMETGGLMRWELNEAFRQARKTDKRMARMRRHWHES